MEAQLNYKKQPKYWQAKSHELANVMRSSISSRSNAAINLSVYKHHVITSALRAIAYDREIEGEYLRIIFSDGSQPTSFPCGVLQLDNNNAPLSAEEVPKEKITKVGLMSLRHPEMDYLVDFYAIENKEIAMLDSTAEEESLAYSTTLNLLNSPNLNEGGEIWVYHTGLEPVVIGFYRAITTVLSWRKEQGITQNLVLRPWIYTAKGAARIEQYNTDSPGASEFNYAHLPCWW
ncbi:MAG: hypothetical protein RPU91_16935 [Candidatus Sedimenticola sp. (ex Thyasira tokunagai)]